MHKKWKVILVAFILLAVFTCHISLASDLTEDRPRVLVFRSLDNIRFDMSRIMNGFQSSLNDREVQVDVLDVHAKYLGDSDYVNGLNNVVQSMIESSGGYDLLILVREPAIRYALEMNADTGSTPVIFAMVENENLAGQVHKQFSAVQVEESVLLRENILLAQTMNESLGRVVVLMDKALMGTSIEEEVMEHSKLFEETLPIEVIETDEWIKQEQTATSESLSNTLIYYLSEHHSANVFGNKNMTGALVLTPWQGLIGKNVDGGQVLFSEEYGETIGDYTKRILEGEPAGRIEIGKATSKYVFDYQNVQAKDLDLKWIAREVEFLNQDISSGSSIMLVLGGAGVLIVLFGVAGMTVKQVSVYRTRKSRAKNPFAEEIVKNVDTAISIKNSERIYVHANDRYKEVFNLPDNLVGLTDEDLFLPEFAEELKAIDNRAIYGSEDYEKKVVYNGSKGALLLDFKVKKVADENGNIHLVSYIGDLTEQRKHEKTLAELNKLLEQQVRDRTGELIQAEKMAMLGTLVAGVSHEISTPIGVSITASTFLSDQTSQLKKQFDNGALKKSELVSFLDQLVETGEILYNNLSNAAEMITNFKKVAVDQASEEIREFNLKDYSRGVVMNLKPKFKHTKHKVHVHGDEDIVMYSYPGAINQILTNLILNSLIHGFEMKDEGEINISVSAREDDLGIHIEYTDDGQGISKETMVKIFDPFFTTKRGKGGSGLGMNIVRNLVEKTLKGKIEVQSEYGQGVKFVLDLPQRINVYENQSESDV